MPEIHATLSASSAHRWLECTAAPSLEATVPAGTAVSEAALEGTEAHSMAEAKLRAALEGRPAPEPTDNTEMEECTDAYVEFVLDAAKALSPAEVAVEQLVNFGHLVPGGFGTADCIVISEDTLHIIDLKYGKGIKVEAEGNPQLRLYALGALAEFGVLYDVKNVRMTIFQPRLSHYSTAEMERADLEAWAATEVVPAAKAADSGDGEFKPGEHCRWCRAKAICRARAESNLALAQKEFKKAPELAPEEIAEILEKGKDLAAWVKDIEEWASAQLKAGEAVPGLKLVAGRGRRTFTDPEAAATTATLAGFDAFEQKPRSLSALEKAMGKKKFAEILGCFVTKTTGEPQLVAASDPRAAWNPVTPETEFTKEN